MTRTAPLSLFIIGLLFFLSGIPGLICEISWGHYLRLAFGSAYQGQLLSVALYMSGLAFGGLLSIAFLRSPKLLLIAALAELLFGLSAFFFQDVFDLLQGVKREGSVLLLLFVFAPAMMSGIGLPLLHEFIRKSFRKKFTKSLSWLYALNTFGALLGVFLLVFYLYPRFDLKTTMQLSSVLNFLAAAGFVFLFLSNQKRAFQSEKSTEFPVIPALLFQAILSAFAGGWILFSLESLMLRFLGVLGGSSVFSFASVLIGVLLGIALGAALAQKKIKNGQEIRIMRNAWFFLTVAIVFQWWFSVGSFDLFYSIIALSGEATAEVVVPLIIIFGALLVLPSSIISGYLFPHYTRMFRVAGAKHATAFSVFVNTLGGMIGMYVVYQLLPVLGLKNIFFMSAFVALCLMMALSLGRFPFSKKTSLWMTVVVFGFGIFSLVFADLPSSVAASGVFRGGHLHEQNAVIFHQDGKLATVDVFVSSDQLKVLSVNGKPDAAVSLTENPAPDELVMNLLGIMPQAFKPHAQNAAVIGLGSGITSARLLDNPEIKEVQTIEIEPVVFDAATHFREFNNKIFQDARSKIIIDDARKFLQKSEMKFDLIISEPSNPWVQGNSLLFAREFYSIAEGRLAPGGMFVQWIHLYENTDEIVFRILKSLDMVFPHWQLYFADNANVLVFASKENIMDPDFQRLYENPDIAQALNRITLTQPGNLAVRYAGNEKYFEEQISNPAVEALSLYDLSIDYAAAEAFYTRNFARKLMEMREELWISGNPAQMFGQENKMVRPEQYFYPAYQAGQAFLLSRSADSLQTMDLLLNEKLAQISHPDDSAALCDALFFSMRYILPNSFVDGLSLRLEPLLREKEFDNSLSLKLKKLFLLKLAEKETTEIAAEILSFNALDRTQRQFMEQLANVKRK